MLSNIIASSEELSVLTKVLDDYCATNGVSQEADRSRVARALIELFGGGAVSEAALQAGLGTIAWPPRPELAA